jgi:hypothetical protein
MIKKIKIPRLSSEDVEEVGEVILTEEEKREIEEEVRAKLAVEKKSQLKRAYLNKMMRQLSGQVDVQHELDEEAEEECLIDLPGHADRIIIDGVHYMHGNIYRFNLHKLRTVKDIMYNAWRHENEIGGAYRDFRKPLNAVLSPKNTHLFTQGF